MIHAVPSWMLRTHFYTQFELVALPLPFGSQTWFAGFSFVSYLKPPFSSGMSQLAMFDDTQGYCSLLFYLLSFELENFGWIVMLKGRFDSFCWIHAGFGLLNCTFLPSNSLVSADPLEVSRVPVLVWESQLRAARGISNTMRNCVSFPWLHIWREIPRVTWFFRKSVWGCHPHKRMMMMIIYIWLSLVLWLLLLWPQVLYTTTLPVSSVCCCSCFPCYQLRIFSMPMSWSSASQLELESG